MIIKEKPCIYEAFLYLVQSFMTLKPIIIIDGVEKVFEIVFIEINL